MRLLFGLVGLGIALTILASFTTAFSTGAEAVTAAALGAFAVGEIAVVSRATAGARARRFTRDTPAPAASRGVALWGVLCVLAVAFELGNYFLSPRNVHPTLSYFLAEAAGQPWSRGVLFAAWLALGAYLVRR